ncbi:carboxypeptidase D, putative [Cryptococcus deneoformans JEC21]|uniref:Carboxypeptidase n=1 Tax=Cryptococcus deneoformans (strain JEC21 / ATCC MYA-565) TaxID=214684 RepID=Q5KJ56_CRYD1|nr:carboxypeptidase D, putative [Cryptococcus neoformans var. neoformans JEC21]AAW43002.1 carboxypeptidase D, putative [Cryptococcus neoformans var. neoformans JEC21]
MWSKVVTTALLAIALGSVIEAASDPSALRGRGPAALAAKEAKKEAPANNASNSDASKMEKCRALLERHPKRKFYNNRTSEFLIESLPEVPFDLGEVYSGLIPIDYNNQSEALFFVFQPKLGEDSDDLTIWLNGGPGCSSLEGWFQENGLWTWQPGTYAPVINPYSWVNLTNMLWVEQPIGTGFSIGTPKATTEEEIAQDFIKWFKNFQDTFGIKNFKIYVTGESYAGRYVPYIGAAMLDAQDKTYYNLSGALMYDPTIGESVFVQEQITTYPFVEANANLFNFNKTTMAELKDLHEFCGYKEYIERYLTFPPTENQPPLFFDYYDFDNITCAIFDIVNNMALRINPCFDIYEINLMCPLLWDVLGMPTQLSYAPGGIYFNRSDVKAAIHAPEHIDWTACATRAVFVGGIEQGPQGRGDLSLDPIQKVLPQVIEATNRVLISNGDYDMVIITNGTLLAIQNMTWNGYLGFQSPPSEDIFIDIVDTQWSSIFESNGFDGYPGPQGVMGIQHYERGLMWAETFQSGHMQPQYQPRSSYRHLQWLLRHVDRL